MTLNSGHTTPPAVAALGVCRGRRGEAQKQTTHQETKTKLSSATPNRSRQQCRNGISTSPTPCCGSPFLHLHLDLAVMSVWLVLLSAKSFLNSSAHKLPILAEVCPRGDFCSVCLLVWLLVWFLFFWHFVCTPGGSLWKYTLPCILVACATFLAYK